MEAASITIPLKPLQEVKNISMTTNMEVTENAQQGADSRFDATEEALMTYFNEPSVRRLLKFIRQLVQSHVEQFYLTL